MTTISNGLDLSGYRLTFADEFDVLGVSGTAGTGATWYAHTPWGGDFGSARFVDPVAGFPFTVSGGVLTIEARKAEDGVWRSGLLSSVDPKGNGFSQQYGYFEISAKLPAGPGLWPAFWMIGENRLDPASTYTAEIDVMEHYGVMPDRYTAVQHIWKRDGSGGHVVNWKHVLVPTGSLYEDFHEYGVFVDQQWTTFYFDRQEVFRVETPSEHEQPMFLLINLALGGGWPIDQAPSPSFMQVDYVRAYAAPASPPPPDQTTRGTDGNDSLKGTSGNDRIEGLGGNDGLAGLAGADTLLGGAGNDVLDGGTGADSMAGGMGDDTFFVDDAGDVISELPNEGYDTVRSMVTLALAANVEKLFLLGTSAISGTGNDGDNVLYGNVAANRLVGLAGRDTIYGGGGADTLHGGDGADFLHGGAGADTLAGDAGADKFDFDSIAESGRDATARDLILDFTLAQGDRIDLATIDANSTVAGNQAFAFIGTRAFSGVSGELRYVAAASVSGTTLIEADINGDRSADMTIGLSGRIDLTSSAFVL